VDAHSPADGIKNGGSTGENRKWDEDTNWDLTSNKSLL